MDARGRCIFIVGLRRLQNELMAEHIERHIGTPCHVSDGLASAVKASGNGDARKVLLLKDCPAENREGLLDRLREAAQDFGSCHLLAMFNVVPGAGIEKDVFPYNVRGVFYQNDTWDTVLKGIKRMFHGELWMSRQVMAECLMKSGRGNGRIAGLRHGEASGNGLTPREVEVLGMIGMGASTEHIADKLCISAHTVKTHTYRVFKKIDATNRVQAALWASQNL
jgi:LuxR family transcriptional regulator of csgAB operon